jgi:hypothetical protein
MLDVSVLYLLAETSFTLFDGRDKYAQTQEDETYHMPRIGSDSGDDEHSFQMREVRLDGFGMGYWDIPIEVLAL